MNDKSALFRAEQEKALRKAARAYLGEALLSAQLLSGGLFNTTYRLETKKRRVILRLGPVNRHLLLPYERNLMAAEGDILQLLKSRGIPTSDILTLDFSREIFDRDVMVVDCLDAVCLSTVEVDKETEHRLCREAGRYTARIHSITAADLPQVPDKPFGRYANVIAGLGGATWKEAILSELAQWHSMAAPAGIFTPGELTSIEECFLRHSPLLDAITVPQLIHGDLWYGNILVDKQQNLAAIIDADRAFFGDPDFEMATGWMISDSFLEGYGSCLNMSPDAVLRRRLYKLLLSLEDCYILFCEYSNPEAGRELKQWILEEISSLNSV